jgi:hypothetical protein
MLDMGAMYWVFKGGGYQAVSPSRYVGAEWRVRLMRLFVCFNIIGGWCTCVFGVASEVRGLTC